MNCDARRILATVPQFDASRRGNKALSYSRHENEGPYGNGEGSEDILLSYPVFGLHLEREGERKGPKVTDGISNTKISKKQWDSTNPSIFSRFKEFSFGMRLT